MTHAGGTKYQRLQLTGVSDVSKELLLELMSGLNASILMPENATV